MKKMKSFLSSMLSITVLSSTCLLGAAATAAADEAPQASFGGAPTLTTRGIHSSVPATQWQDGMISGNGVIGVIDYGDPLSGKYIYQNTKFNMPNAGVREAPDLSGVLPTVRNSIMAEDGKSAYQTSLSAATSWLRQYSGNGNANWGVVWSYPYHPGYQSNIRVTSSGATTNYDRWTNYETGETGVGWHDDNGDWTRKTFVSRADNVIVTYMEKPTGASNFNASVSIDAASLLNFGATGMTLNKVVSPDGDYLALKGKYPAYANSPLQNGGYAGVTKIVTDGSKTVSNETVTIQGASQIVLLTTLDRQETGFQLTDNTLVNQLLTDMNAVANKYTASGKFNYGQALAPHAAIHGEMMNRVSLNLNVDPNDLGLTTEQLIARQNANRMELDNTLVQRMFDSGRYAYISSSGYNPPRLVGMWTGDFAPAWSGDFTTNANLNLQIAGGNIGNTPEAMEGYINLIMRQMDDWELNAERIYGIQNAILAPPKTDGDGGATTHFTADGTYPGEYWNSGASWLLLPVYEYYLTYGNQAVPNGKGQKVPILDILYETLTKLGNFYEGFLTNDYVDSQGKYIFVPSFSPENAPSNRNSPLQSNATMDIAAAKDGLKMLIHVAQVTGHASDVPKWQALLSKLPAYMYNSDGAIKEWASAGLNDNNNHRHISHLYPAWPSLESNETNNFQLTQGIINALDDRLSGGSEAHGFLHRALVGARIHSGQEVAGALLPLFTNNYIFRGLMTSHNSNLEFYNTDALITIPAILMEALAYSDSQSINLLPAVPEHFSSGEVKGLRARNQTTIKELSWDLTNRTVTAVLNSEINQNIKISNQFGIGSIQVTGAVVSIVPDQVNARSLALQAHQDTTVTITWPALQRNNQVLTSEATGKMLQISDASILEGADLVQGNFIKDDSQLWKVVSKDAAYSSIINVKSNKALDISGGSTDDAAIFTLWDITGTNNQLWAITNVSDGYVTITNKNSGKLLTSTSSKEDAAVQQRAVNLADNQLWKLVDAGNGSVKILNKATNFVLKVKDRSASNNAIIVQGGMFKAKSHQEWNLEATGAKDVYKITNVNSGKVLEIQSSPGDLQSNVQQGSWENGDYQKWKIDSLGNGYYKLTNVQSGAALQVSQLSLGDNTPINQGTWSDNTLQKWSIDSEFVDRPVPEFPSASWGGATELAVGNNMDQQLVLSDFNEQIKRMESIVSFNPNHLEVSSVDSNVAGLGVTLQSLAPGKVRVVLEGAVAQPVSSGGNVWTLHMHSKVTSDAKTDITVSNIQITTQDGNQLAVYGSTARINLYALVGSIQVTEISGKNAVSVDKEKLQMTAEAAPLNARDRTFTWSVVNVDGAQTNKASINATGLLSTLRNGQVKVVATANDGSGVKGEYAVTISNQSPALNGQVFGTSPAYAACPTCTFDKVYDGDTATYFDANNGNDQYAGIDLGEGNAKAVNLIRFYPRSNTLFRMNGGKFQGSNTSSSSGFVDLYTIPGNPAAGWSEVAITDPTPYRYLRYLSPNGGYGNVNEIEFYGSTAAVSSIQVHAEGGMTAISEDKGKLQMTAAVVPQTASYTWSVVNMDGTTTDNASITDSGLLTALQNGQVKVVATANDASGVKGECAVTISNQSPVLTGQMFGTSPSYTGCTSCTFDKAFDGNTVTFFDADSGNNQYAGIDLGEGNAKTVKWIRFYPRDTFAFRMSGGKFQGSNTSSSSGFVDLYTISGDPANGWNEITITDSTPYRYLRYVSPNGGFGNVNEIEFYGSFAAVSSIQVHAEGGMTAISGDKGKLQMTAAVVPQSAAITWSVVNMDGTTTDTAFINASGLLSALQNGQVKVVATANDGSGVKGEYVITISNQSPPLTGQIFGTSPAYSGCLTCTSDKVFDGNTATFFDTDCGNDQYAGIDLGEGNAKEVTLIRFFPRDTFAFRMNGGKFQGSNTSSTSGFIDLSTISGNPISGWNEVTITDPVAYRYLRYISPNGGYGNVNEIEFYSASN
ncbi:RICIN domain-containing protein [Paenibacillus oryzisoli]|uniref:glycosyl hydrolase family 95 catalytic domain-containing protein n=1 Tax=Paenibacillus oryzisoli TaxID=1850517 RepID=UPI003D2CD6C8